MDNMKGLFCIVIILAVDLYLVSAKTFSLVMDLPLPVKAGQSAHYNCSSEGTGPDPTIVWSLKDSNGVEKLSNAQLNGIVVEGAADSTDGKFSSLHRVWCGAIDTGSSVPSIQIYDTIQPTNTTTEPNVCVSSPCQNGGTCFDKIDGFGCSCLPGFTGSNCQVDMVVCLSNPCQNGGTCFDKVERYGCSCLPGFTGIYCETACTVPILGQLIPCDKAPCNSSPCQNGGTCINNPDYFTCNCKQGFSGVSCEIQDVCSPNPCQNGGTCFVKVSGYGCNCLPGFTGSNCQTDSLFQFGRADDRSLGETDDSCSERIYYSPGIPVFEHTFKDIFVCSNGIVSFGTPVLSPTPPTDLITRNDWTILAPFFADIEIKGAGKLFYRSYDILNNRTQLNTTDIKRLEDMVKANKNISIFETQFILMATWYRVTPVQRNFDPEKEATFQLALLTDGDNTYAVYIYGAGKMNWTFTGEKPEVFVGYVFPGDNKYSHAFSFTKPVLRMDVNGEESGSAGLIVKRLTSFIDGPTSSAAKCLRWYNKNIHLKAKITQAALLLPECPCDQISLQFDPWFDAPKETYPGIFCTTSWPSVTSLPYGKTCCYNSARWLWTDEKPFAGGLELYHPDVYAREYIINDSDPKRDCCDMSDLCHLYFELHPIGSCYSQTWFRLGTSWGDPHFMTLDGLRFTFNGLGEYTLIKLQTRDLDFELQARTEKAELSNGTLANATVFSAFAVMENNVSVFYVALNSNKTGLILYGDGIDLTEKFEEDTHFKYNHPKESNLILKRENYTLSVLFTKSGISFNVSVGVKMLTLIATMPTKYNNLTRGLLGNFDGVAMNDFMKPNGQILPNNMSEWEIFQYGQLWEINANKSALLYNALENHSTYHNTSYVPIFLDNNDSQLKNQAQQRCGNSLDCIFDYLAMGEAVARNTLSFVETVQATLTEINKTVPKLKGCEMVFVTSNSPAVCPVSVVSGIVVSFQLVEGEKIASFNKSSQSIVIKLTEGKNDPIKISLIGSSDEGRNSPEFRPTVLACSGCSGRGKCLQQTRVGSKETDRFKFAFCQCNPGFDGQDCERDFDGCAAKPCSHGRKCYDVMAEDEHRTNRSFSCSSCLEGFEEIGHKCIDKDECSINNGGCAHNCSNTNGSFRCDCKHGYMIDPADKNKCKDINECDRALHNCVHDCINTDGGYNCSCKPGYSMASLQQKCLPDNSSMDECMKAGLNCSNTAGCTKDQSGDPACFCENGYKLNGNSCKDIDECELNVCSQTCNNLNGSFECGCYPGYKIEQRVSCKECEFPFYGYKCEKRCNCTGRGALACDPVKGCMCQPGWEGNTCNDDINECDISDVPCSDVRTECVNTDGSYRCECRAGYIKDSRGFCTDINECMNPLLNDCEQTCTNVDGGFLCTCQSGYTSENHTCVDIDECRLRTNGCEQICENVRGQYNCYCEYGYILNPDRRSCKKVKDLCKEVNLTCSHFCSVTTRNVFCSCRNGYILDYDNQTCIDYDECSGNLSHGCKSDTACKNIPGSYVCECPNGSKLENDERTCTRCDKYHFGMNCSKECRCKQGLCDPLRGCVCSPGWSGVDCDHDVNECANMTHACSSPNRECVNTFGSFACRCLSGFKEINGSCKQCTDNHFGLHCGEYCNCNAAHVEDINRMCDTVSGKCFCKTTWQGVTCDDDVNECEDQSKCGNLTNTVCHNIKGGYKCDCRRNFERNASNFCNIKTATSNMTTGKPNGTNIVRARIILPNVNLPQGFNLDSASGFEEIANEIHRMLLAFYRKYIQDVIQIEITDIRRGSLIIDYNIIYNTTDEGITDSLVTSAADIVNGAVALTFFGNDVNASAGNSDMVTLCALLVDLEGPCESGTECALQNGKPYCRKSPSKGSVRLIIIIAVTCSAGFLLIVVAAVCFCIIRRKATNAKKKRRKESHGELDKADDKEPHHACAS